MRRLYTAWCNPSMPKLKRPKTFPTIRELLPQTVLAKALLWDECGSSSSVMDANPFGSYFTTATGGVKFSQGLRVIPEYVTCSTGPQIDRFVMNVLVAVAKHCRRYLVVSQRDLNNTSNRIKELLEGPPYTTWAGLNPNLDAAHRSTVLPSNMLILQTKAPEYFGRLSFRDQSLAIAVYDGQGVAVIEVVPDASVMQPPVQV